MHPPISPADLATLIDEAAIAARRLHRKLVVVDGAVGFVGGINFSEDHLAESGPEASKTLPYESRDRW